MIYLEETFNLAHASPEVLDDFIDFSQKHMVPICPDVGARLVAAWSSDVEWYCQVKQVINRVGVDGAFTAGLDPFGFFGIA